MSDCICGFNPPTDPNADCERCQLVGTISSLRAENLRMREALEYFVNIQAHIAGPESSLLACHARIARNALKGDA
jgi:hypothetical protein